MNQLKTKNKELRKTVEVISRTDAFVKS